MVAANSSLPSMRGMKVESSRFGLAVAISMAVHLFLLGGYETGKHYHLWQRWELARWLQPARKPPKSTEKKPTPSQLARLEEERREQERGPLLFIDVNPAVESVEPPKKAEYYSDRNALAANPKPDRDTAIPRIDGKQTDYMKTEDVTMRRPVPAPPATPTQPSASKPEPPKTLDTLQLEVKQTEPKPVEKPAPTPAPPKATPKNPPNESKPQPKPQPQPQPEQKPRPTLMAGDLNMGKPAPTTRTTTGKAEKIVEPSPAPDSANSGSTPKRPRPTTLAEARARQQEAGGGLHGEKARQEGGVPRNQLASSLDTLSTPFGKYDQAIVDAIQTRWDDLLRDRWYADERKGKVTLRFHLNSDGSVTEMKLLENTVDITLALLCESAVRDPAPFKAWPQEMRRIVGREFREVTFTFFYR